MNEISRISTQNTYISNYYCNDVKENICEKFGIDGGNIIKEKPDEQGVSAILDLADEQTQSDVRSAQNGIITEQALSPHQRWGEWNKQ